MGKQYEDAYVKCPFFVSQDKRVIRCEWIDGGARINITFRDGKRKTRWAETHCNGIVECEGCPVYQMLWERS